MATTQKTPKINIKNPYAGTEREKAYADFRTAVADCGAKFAEYTKLCDGLDLTFLSEKFCPGRDDASLDLYFYPCTQAMMVAMTFIDASRGEDTSADEEKKGVRKAEDFTGKKLEGGNLKKAGEDVRKQLEIAEVLFAQITEGLKGYETPSDMERKVPQARGKDTSKSASEKKIGAPAKKIVLREPKEENLREMRKFLDFSSSSYLKISDLFTPFKGEDMAIARAMLSIASFHLYCHRMSKLVNFYLDKMTGKEVVELEPFRLPLGVTGQI